MNINSKIADHNYQINNLQDSIKKLRDKKKIIQEEIDQLQEELYEEISKYDDACEYALSKRDRYPQNY